MKKSHPEYIRNLIVGYEIKIPEVKEELKAKKDEYIIENIDCLIKVKNDSIILDILKMNEQLELKLNS